MTGVYEVQGLVGLTARRGSSPLERIGKPDITAFTPPLAVLGARIPLVPPAAGRQAQSRPRVADTPL
jgi:hypothetical protein